MDQNGKKKMKPQPRWNDVLSNNSTFWNPWSCQQKMLKLQQWDLPLNKWGYQDEFELFTFLFLWARGNFFRSQRLDFEAVNQPTITNPMRGPILSQLRWMLNVLSGPMLKQVPYTVCHVLFLLWMESKTLRNIKTDIVMISVVFAANHKPSNTSKYSTWKVDGATPMYWFVMVP